MINKHSGPSTFANQMVSGMEEALQAEATQFSFAELTSVLVKCANELEASNDKLVNEVDEVLSFIETEFMK